MNNQVNRFKMYKDGKKWIIAGLAATTLGIVSLTDTLTANADVQPSTTTAVSSAATTNSAAIDTASTAVDSAQAQLDSANQNVTDAQSTATVAASEATVAQQAVSNASDSLAAANQQLTAAQQAQTTAASNASAASNNAQSATLANQNAQMVTKNGSSNTATTAAMQAAEQSNKASLPNVGSSNATQTRYAMDGTVYYDASQTQYASAVKTAASWWNNNSGLSLFAAADASHPATLIVTDFNNDLANILATQSPDGTLNLNDTAIEAYGYDAATVLIHEMGHTLGIMHDSVANDIMSVQVPNLRAADVQYTAYEKATVAVSRAVYKANLAASNGNQTLFEQYNGYITSPTKAQYSNENYNQWRTLKSVLNSTIYTASAKSAGNAALTAAVSSAKAIYAKMNVGSIDLVLINQANQAVANLYKLTGDNTQQNLDSELNRRNPTEAQEALNNSQALATIVKNAANAAVPANLTSYSTAVTAAQAAVTAAQTKLNAATVALQQFNAANKTAQQRLSNAQNSQSAAQQALTTAKATLDNLQKAAATTKTISVVAPVATIKSDAKTTETVDQTTSDEASEAETTESATPTVTPAVKVVRVSPVFVTAANYYDNRETAAATTTADTTNEATTVQSTTLEKVAAEDVNAIAAVEPATIAPSESATQASVVSTPTTPATSTLQPSTTSADVVASNLTTAASSTASIQQASGAGNQSQVTPVAADIQNTPATPETTTTSVASSSTTTTSKDQLPQTDAAPASTLLAVVGTLLASATLGFGLRRKRS